MTAGRVAQAALLALCLAAVVPGLAGGAQTQTVSVDGCTTITASGTYELNRSLIDVTNSDCIVINASDVAFDGQGQRIDGTDVAESRGMVISSGATQSNVTVRDVTVTDFSTGIRVDSASTVTVSRANVSSVVFDGVSVSSATDIDFEDSEVRGGTGAGIRVSQSDAVGVARTTVRDAAGDGILYSGGRDHVVADSTIRNVSDGVQASQAENVTARNATVRNTGNDGVLFNSGTSSSTVVDSDIEGTDDDGVTLFETGAGNEIRGNRLASTNRTGVIVENTTGSARVVDNTVRPSLNGSANVEMANASDVTVEANTLRNADEASIAVADGSNRTTVATNDVNRTVLVSSSSIPVRNTTVRNNDISPSGRGTGNGTGVFLDEATGTRVVDNTVTGADFFGVLVGQDSADTTVSGGSVQSSRFGVYVTGVTNATIRDVAVTNATSSNGTYGIGIVALDGRSATVEGATVNRSDIGALVRNTTDGNVDTTRFRDNEYGDLIIEDTTTPFRDIVVGTDATATNVTGSGLNVTLSGVADPPSPPAGQDDIGRFLNVTNGTLAGSGELTPSPGAQFNVTVPYTDGDVTGVNESTLALQRFDGNWTEVSDATVDTGANSAQFIRSGFTTNYTLGLLGNQTDTGGGSGGEPVSTAGSPELTVDPTALSFGSVTVGSRVTETVTVENTGTAPLDVTDVEVGGADAFTATAGTTVLAPGETTAVTVGVAPETTGTKTGTATVFGNDTTTPSVSVELDAEVVESDLAVNTTTVAFGPTAVDGIATAAVRLRNDGSDQLVVNGTGLTGESTAAFGVTGTPETLEPGGTATVEVTFEPTTEGLAAATARVDADGGAVGIALNGTGAAPALGLAPRPVSVGSTAVGTIANATLTVENPGPVPLTVTDVRGDGEDGTVLFAAPRSFVVPPGGQQQVAVTLAPGGLGPVTGRLVVESDAANGSVPVPVEAVGLEAWVAIDPAAAAFGSASRADPARRSVTVRNDGATPVALENLTLAGTDSDRFAVVGGGLPSRVVLDSGEERTVAVRFGPRRRGQATATLRVETNSSDEGRLVAGLSGTGAVPDVGVSSRSLRFNGSGTSTRTLTVRNDGRRPLTVESVSVSGPDGVFEAEASGTLTVAPNATTAVPVRFDPPADETYTGTLRLVTDDPDEPVVPVQLTNGNTTVRVNRTEGDNETVVEAEVEGVDPEEPATVDVEDPEETDDVALTSLTVDTAAEADLEVDATTSTARPTDAPAFEREATRNTEPLAYLDIEADVGDDRIDQATVRAKVRKDRIESLPTTDRDEVAIYRYEGEEYVEKETTVVGETEEYVVYAASADGFSDWTVGAKQADFEVRRATVNVTSVVTGDSVTVLVRITNTGGADGDYRATLLLDREVIDRREVFIAANGTSQVTFEPSFTRPGEYQVLVNDVQVDEVAVSPPPNETTTAAEDTSSGIGGRAGDALWVVVAALVVAYWVRRG